MLEDREAHTGWAPAAAPANPLWTVAADSETFPEEQGESLEMTGAVTV
jgi:hypothetical protein